MLLSKRKAKYVAGLCFFTPLVFVLFLILCLSLGLSTGLSVLLCLILSAGFVLYTLLVFHKYEDIPAGGGPGPGVFESLACHVVAAPTHYMESTFFCTMSVDFPAECRLREPVSLKVELVVSPTDSGEEDRALPYTKLSEHASGEAFDFETKWKEVPLSASETNRVSLNFHATPRIPGKQTIGIETFHQAQRIGYREVLTLVTDEEAVIDETTRAHVAVYENQMGRMEPVFPEKDQVCRRLLRVSRKRDAADTLDFLLLFSETGKNAIQASTAVGSEEEVTKSIRPFLNTLDDLVRSDGTGDAGSEDVLEGLSGIGEKLFLRILPPSIQTEVASWPNGSIVGIISEEPWIPWEICHDGKDFLCRRFILYRQAIRPRDYDGRRLGDLRTRSGLKQGGESFPVHKIVNIIGGGLGPRYESHLERMFEFAGEWCEVLNVKPQGISDLKERAQGSDILHFTCHGRHPEERIPYLQISSRSATASAQNLLLTSVNKLPLTQTALVFMNTCRSETAQLLFREFASFGWEFYESGAHLCVGTLVSMPQDGAVEFSRLFYEKSLRENLPIHQAFAEAREILLKQGRHFALFYCLYGDPAVSFTTERRLQSQIPQ